MTRYFVASLIGLMVFTQSAWADLDGDDLGRYQIVPGAVVPGKAGKATTKTMLIDTSTGETWVLMADAKSGGKAGAVWVQVKIMAHDGKQTARSVSGTRVQESSTSDEKIRRRTRPLHFDYENDP